MKTIKKIKTTDIEKRISNNNLVSLVICMGECAGGQYYYISVTIKSRYQRFNLFEKQTDRYEDLKYFAKKAKDIYKNTK